MQQNHTIKQSILRVLQEVEGPAGAARIAKTLLTEGVDLSPRTIRFHLLQMDREGLTKFISRRRGREVTARGRDELAHGNVIEKVGFIAAKIDGLGYRMTFRNGEGRGAIISNVATIPAHYLARAIETMKPVFARRLGMGDRVALAREGQMLGGQCVPRGMVSLGTVCSMTVNGIMLAERISVTARFGGLLEVREGKPVRFLELLEYRGTTMDPLEFFIHAKMTRVRQCAQTGTGVIGASFREVPSVALDDVHRISREMERHGLGGIMTIGRPNQPLLNIPVAEGRAGMIVIAGLNPVAAMVEAGAQVTVRSLVGLEDYSLFMPFQALRDRFPASDNSVDENR
jgi:HTH-type transcriptional regulator, global nitrogen regulator NrpRI